MSDANTPWYIAAGGTIIAALSSALTFLFKLRENENSRNISKLEKKIVEVQVKADKCENDRVTLFAECAVLREKVSALSKQLGIIDTEGTKHSKGKQ